MLFFLGHSRFSHKSTPFPEMGNANIWIIYICCTCSEYTLEKNINCEFIVKNILKWYLIPTHILWEKSKAPDHNLHRSQQIFGNILAYPGSECIARFNSPEYPKYFVGENLWLKYYPDSSQHIFENILVDPSWGECTAKWAENSWIEMEPSSHQIRFKMHHCSKFEITKWNFHQYLVLKVQSTILWIFSTKT